MNDTEEQIFKIPIESLFEEFKNHIDIKNNSRIVFSGKFGTGKTYFLNEFFKDETNEKEYEVFHLYPVNYQISQNEDIIELFKYDILVELSEKELFKDDDEHDKTFVAFIKEKWNTKAVLNGIIENTIELSLFSKLGRPLKTFLKLDENFQKFKKSSKKETINEFLKENNSETDVISQIIKHKIVNLEKKSVLILDDLDRIDPEHIFRILNVFSAHFDQSNEEFSNKFGFDKIILVADVKNIKSIFHHKYGEKADFNGYFDKFFSIEIFHFNNKNIIAKYVREIVGSFKCIDRNVIGEEDSDFIKAVMYFVLSKSFNLTSEKINLRSILKDIGSNCDVLVKNKEYYAIININLILKKLIKILEKLKVDIFPILKDILTWDYEGDNFHNAYFFYHVSVVSGKEINKKEHNDGSIEHNFKGQFKQITFVDKDVLPEDPQSLEKEFLYTFKEYIEQKKYLEN